MKKLSVILACLMLFVFGSFWDYSETPSNISLVQNAPKTDLLTEIPNAVIKPLKGVPFGLHELQGKMVLVNFWATWCAPCAEEFPVLLAFAKANPNIVLLAVSVDEAPERIEPFFAKLGLSKQLELANVIVAVDPAQQLAGQFQSFQYPETYVLTPALQLQEKIIGKVTAEKLGALLIK